MLTNLAIDLPEIKINGFDFSDEAVSDGVDAERYRYDPNGYIQHYFGWSLWSGGDNVGQQEIADAYVLSLRKQHERQAF